MASILDPSFKCWLIRWICKGEEDRENPCEGTYRERGSLLGPAPTAKSHAQIVAFCSLVNRSHSILIVVTLRL